MTTNIPSMINERGVGRVTELSHARFRSARLDIQDVRDIDAILASSARRATWQCSQGRSVVAPEGLEPKSPFTISTVKVVKGSDLSELLENAPKGRLFHLEVEAIATDGSSIFLTIGAPFKKARWLILSFAGESIPIEYYKAIAVLDRAAKRGEKWHVLATMILPNTALFGGIGIYVALNRFYAVTMSGEPGYKPEVATIVGMLATSLIAIPMFSGIWRHLTASSVALRPRFDPTPLWRKTMAGLRWIGALYRKDELLEQKMLIATVTSMLVAIISVFVAILAWVMPRN